MTPKKISKTWLDKFFPKWRACPIFEKNQLVAIRFLKHNNNSIFFGNVSLDLVDDALVKEIKTAGVQYGRDRAS